MKLTNQFKNDITETIPPVYGLKNTTGSQPSKGFDQILTAMEKRDVKTPEPKQRAKPTERDNNQRPPSNENPETTKNNTFSDSKQVEYDKKPVAEKSAEEPQTSLTEDENQEVIAIIAEILQVPPETVLQWLDELGLQPNDLMDMQNVVELLQAAFGENETAVLLTSPAFSTAYKAINEAMNMLKPEMEIAAPIEMMENETVSVRMPVFEGLQVTQDENNEIVVVNQQSTAVNAAAVLVEDEETDNTFSFEESEDALSTGQSQTVAATVKSDSGNAQSDAQTQQDDDTPFMMHFDETNAPTANNPIESFTTRVAEVTETAKAQTSTPVNASDVMNQIMSRVRAQSGDHFTELRIMLKPENLGDVTLRVMTQNGIVTAQFVAESQRVKEVLESNFNQLRDALTEQGIKVSELSVSVQQDENERMNQFAQAQQNSRVRMQRVNKNIEATEETGFGDEVDPSVVLQGNMNFTA